VHDEFGNYITIKSISLGAVEINCLFLGSVLLKNIPMTIDMFTYVACDCICLFDYDGST
jgi:hypothetical protein